MSQEKKYYLDIPYALKDLAKTHKCQWDTVEKKWFTYDVKHFLLDEYELVDLSKFSFDDKEYIKSNGGRYNPSSKTWYTHASNKQLEKYF